MSPSRVLIGVGGGIAAYKVCEVISTLVQSDIEVRAILTSAAQEFVTPLTLTTLCRHPVYTDSSLWQPTHLRPLHIELGEWPNVILLAPLTANTLAKLAMGLADNLLTNSVLASTCPILVAPAMNTTMWHQPAVQRNWEQLAQEGRYHSLGPESGLLACDTVGAGRMSEPPAIVAYLKSLLTTGGKRDLEGLRVLISAGGTREHLDPVRFLGNPATGKMGLALAEAAFHRGATVKLVHGPLPPGLTPSPPIEAVAVTSADQMKSALLKAFPETDWMIMAAAVGDFKPSHYASEKLPKRSLPNPLPLKPIPDILKQLAQHKQPHQRLIGFAAQTGDILPPAQEKLAAKQLDAIVANPIDQPDTGFGSDQNQAIFIDRSGHQIPIPACSKLHMAHRLLDLISELNEV